VKRPLFAVFAALLLFAGWKVHAVRTALGAGDGDPAVTARLQEGLARLPLSVGTYVGREAPIASSVVRGAGADVFASRVYDDGRGNAYHLYVGGSVHNQENFHAPRHCMPAAGWEVLEESTTPAPFRVAGSDSRVRRLLLQRGPDRMLVHYWFQAGDEVTPEEFRVRWLRFRALLVGRPFAPSVIVAAYTPVKGTVEESEERLSSFLAHVVPPVRQAIGGTS
jgi:EpsI family protein